MQQQLLEKQQSEELNAKHVNEMEQQQADQALVQSTYLNVFTNPSNENPNQGEVDLLSNSNNSLFVFNKIIYSLLIILFFILCYIIIKNV
jgi:hypothetical protein